MVEINRETAEVIQRVLDDINNLDARMSCSDAGFRRHFKLLAHNPVTVQAWLELKRALAKQPDE